MQITEKVARWFTPQSPRSNTRLAESSRVMDMQMCSGKGCFHGCIASVADDT
ncbi:MAG: hypothetical protein ABI767_01685 [Rhodanobacter sp.]